MGLFRRFRNRLERDAPEGIYTVGSGDTGLVTVDLDSFGPDAKEGPLEEVARINRLPLFGATIKHGFSRRVVGSTDKCPRCGAATRQQNANPVYATDVLPA